LQAIERLGLRAECEDGYTFTEADIRHAGSALSLSPDFAAHRPTRRRLPMLAMLGRQSHLDKNWAMSRLQDYTVGGTKRAEAVRAPHRAAGRRFQGLFDQFRSFDIRV